MPTVVDIPNVGVVEFPDGMAQEDVARESESLYSRFARNQPPPKYEGMLAGPPGFEQPARSSEELAAREQRARETTPGLPSEGTARPAGQVLTETLLKLHRLTDQEVQDAWSFISAWGAAGEGWISPETAQEIAGAQSEKPRTAAKVTAGLINAAETVPETFTSLAGAAPLAAPGRLTSAGFAIYMASQTPQAVTAWRDALKTGDPGMIAETSAGLALHGLMTFAAGRHAVTSPKAIKAKQLADAIRVSEAEAGRLMATPEWKAAVDKAAAAGVRPVERFTPKTAEAMREMGPFKGEFVETGAPEVKVEPPVVPPARETVVPNVQTELETKPTELQPASPELKGAEDASRIPSDETKPAAAGVQPEAGKVVRSADVERPAPVEPEPVVARGEEAERPAPEAPQPEVTKAEVTGPVEPEVGTQTTIIDPRQVPIIELPLDRIQLSKDVPNFKAGADLATGVVPGQQLEGKFERLGTPPIVVWKRINGDLEVITGRHRLDLARRSGEKTIPAQVVDEAAGFTRQQAITFDAASNIRDGQGSVEDYADFFRNSPQLAETEARQGGLLARVKGRAGWDIGKLASDDLYALYKSGKISEAQTLAVVRAAGPDPAAQRIGSKFALQGKAPDFLSNVIKASQAESTQRAVNLDLFGADDSALQDMARQAERAAAEVNAIQEQVRAISGAAKRPEVARKLGVDVSDPASVQAKVAELKAELARWDNWPLHPDLVDRVRGKPKAQPPKAEAKPPPPPTPKPTGGDLFGSEEMPFNLAGETVKPAEAKTGYGADTMAQQEMFAIQQIVELKDPAKSANEAQRIAGGDPAQAASMLARQLAVVDSDPVTKRAFAKEQRQRLKEVIALLQQRSANAPIVGMGGAVPEELPPPTPQATISRLKAKEAARMEAKVKLPVEYDLERLNEQFDIFTSEIGDALTTGGQFLAKQRRPAVAKGAPAEPATVTSKQVNQYFTSKLVTLVNEIRRIKSDLAQQASPEHEQYLDLVLERAKNTFRQVQELRRASHESLAFWNKIKAEMIDMQQALGVMGDIKRRLPILDQLWKDTRERQFRRAGKDLLEFARVNLFTLGSWTLDFATNLAVAATKLPAFAMGDTVSLLRGNSAHRMASALRAAWRSAKNLVPGERFRLPQEIESRLGTVAGAEFQGYGKEVMADFSEILKDKPAAAEQLKKLDIVLAAPVRMKRATDNFFGRLGASTELYHQAYEAGHKAGLRGDDLQTFVDNFFQTPPREAIDAAVKEGKEWKFNRDLTEWEEKFASNTLTKLAIEAYPRWTLQFVRWAGEMLGVNPSLYLKIKQGRATQQEVIDGLVKAATGWGGIVAFNQLVYDNIDANTMEYVKEDGDRVRLSGRTPAPELFFITALLRGDWQKAKAALSQTSLPLAKLLGGEPGGIISPVVDTMRESVRGKYTVERTASELSKLLNNAIPGKSVLGFFRALYDPSIREGLGAPIPGVAGLLPQKIEPTTGEPAAPMQRIPGTQFKFPTVGGTPFPGAVRDLNAIQAVLMNHGLAVTRPRRTSIIELPPEDVPKAQRREYEKISGQNVKRIVGEAITNPEFWQSPPEIRRKLLQAWMNAARAQARNAMAEKYGTSNKPVKSEPIPVGLLPDKFKPTK